MCEVLTSPTVELMARPLRTRQPRQTTASPLTSANTLPYAEMFATHVKRSEAMDIKRSPKTLGVSEGKIDLSQKENLLKHTGRVTMLAPPPSGKQGSVKLPVLLSVHCTQFDKYAVISQERVVCKDCGYVNLKTCRVRAVSDTCFHLAACDGEKQPLVFMTSSEEELNTWLEVLGQCSEILPHSSSPRSSSSFLSTSPRSHSKPLLSLTALSEEEEEEEEEEASELSEESEE